MLLLMMMTESIYLSVGLCKGGQALGDTGQIVLLLLGGVSTDAHAVLGMFRRREPTGLFFSRRPFAAEGQPLQDAVVSLFFQRRR